MISYWFRNYLTCAEVSLACVEIMSLWWLPRRSLPESSGAEPWLSHVPWAHRPPARGNCFAAAYAHWGLPLSRIAAVNDPLWCRTGCDRF